MKNTLAQKPKNLYTTFCRSFEKKLICKEFYKWLII